MTKTNVTQSFLNKTSKLSSPAARAFEITPDSSTDLVNFTRALYVGEGGDIEVILVGDDIAVTFVGSGSSEASGIVGLY